MYIYTPRVTDFCFATNLPKMKPLTNPSVLELIENPESSKTKIENQSCSGISEEIQKSLSPS